MEMQLAQVENPNDHAAADAAAAAARAQPDMRSQWGVPCYLAFTACVVFVVAASLVVLFCRSSWHASMFGRVLAGFGLVVGIVCFAFGACYCAVAADRCIHGNPQGTRQNQAPHVAA